MQRTLDATAVSVQGDDATLPPMMMFAVGADVPTLNRLVCRTAMVDAMAELRANGVHTRKVEQRHRSGGEQPEPGECLRALPSTVFKSGEEGGMKPKTESSIEAVQKNYEQSVDESFEQSNLVAVAVPIASPQPQSSEPPAVVLRNPRGNQPRSYDPQDLQAALRDVQNGGSIYR